ncbi:radical SAM protein [Nitrospinae bacterium AH_259_B05_G02_I21]|nr:radical SAM protein [Nitrospinae bacterium AH_259_B05_G02_I21]MDA2931665.1 radical SAM protein [Nitrospinae bacterium AH-259-F20]
MKKYYWHVTKVRLQRLDFWWFLQQAWKYVGVPLSHQLGKPLHGPILGGFVLTYGCDAGCFMCDLPQRAVRFKKQKRVEFDTAQMLKVVDEFVSIGTTGIGFMGGEPLLRKDFFEIIKYSDERGLPVSVFTNGHFLDRPTTKEFLKSGIQSVGISLDSVDAETHDRLRGSKGSFKRATDAIANLRALRESSFPHVALSVGMCVSETNLDEVIPMVELAEKVGVDQVYFEALHNYHNDYSPGGLERSYVARHKVSDAEKLDRVIDELLEIKRSNGIIGNSESYLKLLKRSLRGEELPIQCYAGYTTCFVDCFGSVFPCVTYMGLRRSIGNIQEKNLKEIWVSEEYRQLRGELSACRECFHSCNLETTVLFNRIP